MAPKRKKVVIEDETYSSKPMKKQKTFTPRLKTIKSTAMRSTPRSTSNKIPLKRERNQSSMTQLDFGRRSLFELISSDDKKEICDSDDDEELKSDNEIVDQEDQEVVEEKPKKSRRSTSKLPGKTESQPSFTQFVRRGSGVIDMKSDGEDEAETPKKRTRKRTASTDSISTETSATTTKSRRSKSKLPGKTDSQPSYTQFVRRWPSDAAMIEIQDSEDEGVDESVSDADAGIVDEPLQRKASQELEEELPTVVNQSGKHVDRHMADRDLVAEVEDASGSTRQPPRTPKRARPTFVPSSRSPADSPLSTQATSRCRSPLDQRSPLKELSVNLPRLPCLRRVDTSPSKPSPLKQVTMRASPDVERVVESPTKHRGLAGAQSVRFSSTGKVLALGLPVEDTWGSSMSEEFQPRQPIVDVCVPQAPGRRQTRASLAAEAPSQLSQEPVSLLAKASPAKRFSQRRIRATAGVKSRKESPTKRRVRDFNARMAMLERENSEQRSKILQCPDFPSSKTRAKNVPKVSAAPKETQYTMPGLETQAALFQLPLDLPAGEQEPDVEREEIVENSQIAYIEDEEEHIDEHQKVGDQARLAHEGTDAELEPFEDACDDGEEVLIPSSQTKKTTKPIRHTIASSQADSDEELDEGEEPILDESLPESPYPPASARSTTSMKSKDTQDLASDQLLRETQQTFMYRVPSSPAVDMLPPKSTQTHTQDFAVLRPSQATTVDESATMRHSSFHTQVHHQQPPTLEHKTSSPRALSSSSPPSEPFLPPVQPIASSPLIQPPGMSDGLSSSSPRMPKTPQILRNLKEARVPLRIEDLMTESLEQSYRMPPGWDNGFAAVDEESDDGEL